LVDLHDDSSAESISRLSGDSSVTFPSFNNNGISAIDGHNYVETLLRELSGDRMNKNPMDAMIFFLFAVIPLVAFAQLREAAMILLPSHGLKNKARSNKDPMDIEAAWQELRANALMLEEEFR